MHVDKANKTELEMNMSTRNSPRNSHSNVVAGDDNANVQHNNKKDKNNTDGPKKEESDSKTYEEKDRDNDTDKDTEMRREKEKDKDKEKEHEQKEAKQQKNSNAAEAEPETEMKTERPKLIGTKVYSVINDLFCGEVISEVECRVCGHISSTKDILYDISVEIPKTEQIDKAVNERSAEPLKKQGFIGSFLNYVGIVQQTVPLELCLHTYCTSEDLVQTEKYHCDRCKEKVEAKKRLSISRLPEILMIHVKRFSHNSFWNGSSKVTTQVEFPITDFNFKQYIHHQYLDESYNKDTIYDLCSFVKHIGGTGGGHYIAFGKHPARNQWYKFDDHLVEKVSVERLCEQQAYILFYSRRKQDSRIASQIQQLLSISDAVDSTNHNDSPTVAKTENNNVVQVSRYWFHKISKLLHMLIFFFCSPSPPPLPLPKKKLNFVGPLDNLWLSCFHGQALSSNHPRRRYLGAEMNEQVWERLQNQFGYLTDASPFYVRRNSQGSTEEQPSEQPKPWALEISSQHCDECRREELVLRRQYEKEEISKLQAESVPNDIALSIKWANKWRKWISGESQQPPGPLDNSNIAGENHMLKKDVTKEDYIFMSTPMWMFLHEVYGGGPKVLAMINTPKKNDNNSDEKNTNTDTNSVSHSPKQKSHNSKSKKNATFSSISFLHLSWCCVIFVFVQQMGNRVCFHCFFRQCTFYLQVKRSQKKLLLSRNKKALKNEVGKKKL
ncbi:hypothetical protein RFI_15526 [Reticulomyxa filosa]|uniref:Uncharacterized protein n=1 Tax=Reticulomyxa filosa TaxID=46433 RepID=X6N6J6_RETFI|nr:hypothetical protein RFI_15526 [Reticulomyxa filosa]|eukprot:ETO21681.1 hypothetical protein RFI_15526 [Reticulomyxa filosa]